MHDSSRLRKVIKNRFPMEGYIFLYIALVTNAVYTYIKICGAYTARTPDIPAWISVILPFGIGGLILSWKTERNILSLVTGMILPVLMYEVRYLTWDDAAVKIVFIVGVMVSSVISAVWAGNKLDFPVEPVMKRELYYEKFTRGMRICLCLLFGAMCAAGASAQQPSAQVGGSVSFSDVSYFLSDSRDDIPDYENSLAANIETVSKIDSACGWHELTLEERTEVLKDVIRVECRYLGMRDSAPSLEIAHLDEAVLGQYCRETDTVTISYDYLMESDAGGYAVLQVLCHEMYHRYQFYQVEMLRSLRGDSSMELYKDLLMFSEVSVYEEEMKNYISGTDGGELSYLLYRYQQLELSADKYRESSMMDFYDRIQDYLSSD